MGAYLILAVMMFFLGRIIAHALQKEARPFAKMSVASVPAASSAIGLNDAGSNHAPEASSQNSMNGSSLESRLSAQVSNLASQAQLDAIMDELAQFADSDPRRAIEFARQHLKPPFLDQALARILDRWVDQDPAAAWAWAKENPGEDNVFPDQVLNKVAITAPDTAWAFASELAARASEDSAGFYVSALRGMIYAGNYQAAARLLGSAQLPSKSLDSNYGLPGFIASAWAQADPEAAGQWVLGLPAEGNARQQAISGLAQSWPLVDPQGAVNFATQLPATASRLTMLTAGVNEWFARDPAQVNAWASAIPHDGDYDQFAAALASAPNLVSASPQNSIAWAESISSPGLEVESLAQVFTHWIQMADTPALAYLQNPNSFPPAVRFPLLHRLGLNIP